LVGRFRLPSDVCRPSEIAGADADPFDAPMGRFRVHDLVAAGVPSAGQMGTVQVVAGVICIAAATAYLWSATRLANYTAPWSAPWRVGQVARLGAVGNAAIRLLALGGIAVLLAWQYGAGPPSGYRTWGYGLGWFPPTESSRSISLPDLKWIWLTLMAVAFVFIAGERIRRRRTPTPPDLSVAPDGAELALAPLIDESLAALLREADPRRAILACYAQMERRLARRGIPRMAQETALEYAGRLLVLAGAPIEPVNALTELFHVAGFSKRVVDEEMRQTAIRSLRSVAEAST
jgi:hypothetical protein